MSATEIQEVFLGKPGSEFSRRNWISDGGWGEAVGGDRAWPIPPSRFPFLQALLSFPPSSLTQTQ